MRPPIKHTELTDTLSLSLCHRTMDSKEGFYLYDATRGMNLAMGEPTEQAAFVKAIEYYQNDCRTWSGHTTT